MGRVQLDSVGLPAKGKGERTKETLKNTLEPKVTYLRKEVLPVKVRSSTDSYALMPNEMLACVLECYAIMILCYAMLSCYAIMSRDIAQTSAALLIRAQKLLRSGSRALSNSTVANFKSSIGRRKKQTPARAAQGELE